MIDNVQRVSNCMKLRVYLSLHGSTALCWTLAAFQFLDLYTVGKTPWTGGSASRKADTYTGQHKNTE
jgi:hypothetical protein